MKKILVIGAKGMAGHVVSHYLESLGKYSVWKMARNFQTKDNSFDLDIYDIDGLGDILISNKFDYVINCIGILNRDAEDNPEKAVWFNSYFPHWLSSMGKKCDFKLVHISTDCVFSGKEGGYTEQSFKNGIGYYAQSKALGEVINEKDLTFRTSIIGPELNIGGIGLFHWFMGQKNDISGYRYAFWTGVTTLELAKAIDAALDQNLTGLYHLVNGTKISKFDLLNLFNLIFKNDEIKISSNDSYKVDKSLIDTRNDFVYEVPSYKNMILEMKKYMDENKSLYQQNYSEI